MSLYQFYNNEVAIRRIAVIRVQNQARREARLQEDERAQLEAFK